MSFYPSAADRVVEESRALPEMFDPSDVLLSDRRLEDSFNPREERIESIYFYKHTPSLFDYRARKGRIMILAQPDTYRLQILYTANPADKSIPPRVLVDYPNLIVQ